jgi:hypothetical protein
MATILWANVFLFNLVRIFFFKLPVGQSMLSQAPGTNASAAIYAPKFTLEVRSTPLSCGFGCAFTLLAASWLRAFISLGLLFLQFLTFHFLFCLRFRLCFLLWWFAGPAAMTKKKNATE